MKAVHDKETPLARRLIIAVLDDDVSVCNAIANLMRASGFLAVTYNSAQDFIGRHLEDQIELLVTDFQMPGMTGIDLVLKLRADGNGLPIIIITALPHTGIAESARLAGALACFRKPIDHSALLDLIRKALEDPS